MNDRTATLSAQRLEAGHPARLWYAVAGAPVAWAAQSGIGWFVTGRACADGDASGATRAVLLAVGGAALLAGLYAVVIGRSAWRRTHGSEDVLRSEGRSVVEYVLAAGVLVSSVFILAIIWTMLPAVMVDVCQGVR
jgi:hypothetical protein